MVKKKPQEFSNMKHVVAHNKVFNTSKFNKNL